MIFGRFGNTSGRPHVEGRLILPGQNISSNISFLVDTGADSTVIMPNDGKTISISYGDLRNPIQSIGVGGASTIYKEPAVIGFYEPNRKKTQFFAIRVGIIEPDPNLNGLPSLLGRDILDRLRMVYDPSRSKLQFTVISSDYTA